MKKVYLVVILLSFLVSSCATMKPVNIPERIDVSMLDFKQFQDQGVLISPYSCEAQKYSAVGEISVTYVPNIVAYTQSKQKKNVSHLPAKELRASDLYTRIYEPRQVVNETPIPDLYTAVQKMVDEVLQRGGNAVFDFKYRYLDAEKIVDKRVIEYTVLEISGFAVNLKE